MFLRFRGVLIKKKKKIVVALFSTVLKKKKIIKVFVSSVLLYGVEMETWCLSKRDIKRPEAVELWNISKTHVPFP